MNEKEPKPGILHGSESNEFVEKLRAITAGLKNLKPGDVLEYFNGRRLKVTEVSEAEDWRDRLVSMVYVSDDGQETAPTERIMESFLSKENLVSLERIIPS